MATLLDISTGVQTLATTGAVTATAGADVAAITGDWTIKVRVTSLTAAKKVLIGLEDSVNAFTASIVKITCNPVGAISSAVERVYSFRKYQFPSVRCGTGSAVLRANILAIDGSTTVSLHSWIES